MTAVDQPSAAGLWNRWYGLLDPKRAEPYGDSVTYRLAADWVADCPLVEDWGTGKGWMRRFIPRHRYRGIDGSDTPFADRIADLTIYRSNVPAVVIRHVLEHERRWRDVLDNALASARRRLFIALFTPLASAEDGTHEIAFAEDPGVPDLSFYLPDLTGPIEAAGFNVEVESLTTPTQYGMETVLRCARL